MIEVLEEAGYFVIDAVDGFCWSLTIKAKREILDGNRIASKDPVEHWFKNFARFGPDRHTGLTQS